MWDVMDAWRSHMFNWPGSRHHDEIFAGLYDRKYGLAQDELSLRIWWYYRNGFDTQDLPALSGASEEEVRKAMEVLGLR